jgi:hypothetical protein
MGEYTTALSGWLGDLVPKRSHHGLYTSTERPFGAPTTAIGVRCGDDTAFSAARRASASAMARCTRGSFTRVSRACAARMARSIALPLPPRCPTTIPIAPVVSSRRSSKTTTVKLKFRWPDFTTPTRQLTLPQPTDESEVIAEAALRLFGQIWTGEQAVRLIGVGISGLGAPPRQLSLWDASIAPTPEQLARQQRVEAALAVIQARFGAGAVRRASELEQP